MMLSYSLHMHTEGLKHPYHESVSENHYPDSIDWRQFGFVTRVNWNIYGKLYFSKEYYTLQVKSQGSNCKASWAFSATAAVEAQYRKIRGQLVSLSEQQLLDCSGLYSNRGCNGGTVKYALDYIHTKGGICAEKDYPYLGYVSYTLMYLWL